MIFFGLKKDYIHVHPCIIYFLRKCFNCDCISLLYMDMLDSY